MPGNPLPQSMPNETMPTTVAMLELRSEKYWSGPPLSPWQLSFLPCGSNAQYWLSTIPFRNAAKSNRVCSKNVALHSGSGIVDNCVFNKSLDRCNPAFFKWMTSMKNYQKLLEIIQSTMFKLKLYLRTDDVLPQPVVIIIVSEFRSFKSVRKQAGLISFVKSISILTRINAMSFCFVLNE